MFYYFDFTGWMLTQILTFYDSTAIPPPPFLRRQFPRNTCNNNPPFNAKFTKNFPKFLQQFWMEKKIYIYFKNLYPTDIFKTFEIQKIVNGITHWPQKFNNSKFDSLNLPRENSKKPIDPFVLKSANKSKNQI